MRMKLDNFIIEIYNRIENDKGESQKSIHFLSNVLDFIGIFLMGTIIFNEETANHPTMILLFSAVIWSSFLTYDTGEFKNIRIEDKILFFLNIFLKICTPFLMYFIFKKESMLEEIKSTSFIGLIGIINIILILIVSCKKGNFFNCEFKKIYLLCPIISLILFAILFSIFQNALSTWGQFLFTFMFVIINHCWIIKIEKIEKMYFSQKIK